MTRLRSWRWLLPILFVAGACWTGNLTLYNFWAAGGPPTAHPEVYEQRAYVFLLITASLLLVAFLVAIVNVKRRRQDKREE